MTINDAIQIMQQLADACDAGLDSELVLFDRSDEREIRVDLNADVHDFEFTRGDGEIVIEFN